MAEHSLRGGMHQMMHAGNGHPDPEAAIELIRQALLEKQRTRTILGLMIASDRDREIKKPLRDMISHARGMASAVLQQLGVEPTPQLATLLHACLVGFAVVTFAYDTPDGDREVGDAAETLLRMVAGPPPARPRRRGSSKPKSQKG